MGSASNTIRGFSLLEAMVAVAISSVVLLMAAAAVRGASQSLRKMETISEENHLLVKGWLIALDDVDYWNSHANPDYPYLAGPMGEVVTVDVGGTPTTDHPWDKRPFKPVVFSDEVNPNLLLPHDPKSWYRGGNLVELPPMARVGGNYDLRWVWRYASDAIAGERLNAANTNQELTYVLYPTGWSPWHMVGSYSDIARALAAGDGSTELADTIAADSSAVNLGVARAVTDAMPSTQWFLFSELGHAGAAAYLPPGALNLVHRPNYNRQAANIGDQSKLYDWGELPWSLASGSQTDPTATFSAEAFLLPDESTYGGTTMAQVVRRNMLLGFPGSGRAMDEVYVQQWDGNLGINSSRYYNNRGTSNTVYSVDYETASSRHRSITNSGGGGDYYPTAMFYPGRVFRIGTDFDTKSLVDRTLIDPFRMLIDDDANTSNVHSERESANTLFMEDRFSMTTQHQPTAATNDDRRLAGFGTGLEMRHRIVRFHAVHRDINSIVVTVVNPQTGTRIDLQARVNGTNWKGARAHWGWVSQQSGWTHGPMGDRYVP